MKHQANGANRWQRQASVLSSVLWLEQPASAILCVRAANQEEVVSLWEMVNPFCRFFFHLHQEKINKLFDRKVYEEFDTNSHIQKKKEFRNPR